MAAVNYPFLPKSAVSLQPGQFWGVPLKDGSFGCGRVIQAAVKYAGASRVVFLGALLDWHARTLPTADAIANAGCIAHGKIHVKSLKTFGTEILGFRPLEIDGISPQLVRWDLGDPHGWVLLGLEPVRKETKADSGLPSNSFWGPGYIRALAEDRFLGKENES